jgi:ABC-2 type transport system permease protein
VKHVTTVASRELRSLFVSPVAYGVLSLFAVLAGFFFLLSVGWFSTQLLQLQQFQMTDRLEEMNLNDHLLTYFFGDMTTLLLFLVPGITMGLFAAEKTNGTQELLMTSPLTIWDIVLGKFVAGGAFIGVLVAIAALFPGLLFLYGDPELGRTLSGLLAVLLVGWVYVAIGAFASSITQSQVVAILISFVLMVMMLLLPAVSSIGVVEGAPWIGDAFRYASAMTHFENLVKGVVDTADLAYFAVAIAIFAFLSKSAVESARWR